MPGTRGGLVVLFKAQGCSQERRKALPIPPSQGWQRRAELRPGRWDPSSDTAASPEPAPALKTLLTSQLLLHFQGICHSRRSIPPCRVSRAVQRGGITKSGMEEELGEGSGLPHPSAVGDGWQRDGSPSSAQPAPGMLQFTLRQPRLLHSPALA